MTAAARPYEVNHCDLCGRDATCTPDFDFWSGGIVPAGQLACQTCFDSRIFPTPPPPRTARSIHYAAVRSDGHRYH